jgi:Dna[CI] antecedent, DciA
MEPIRADVERELGRFGPAAGMARVVSAGPAAVGETVARNAWPARFARDGTLHVATGSSAWAFELSQLAPTVLERLRAALGGEAPAALRFAPGRLPEPSGPPTDQATTAVAAPTAEERELGAALASGIGDSELRRLVARAAAASLSRAAADR